MLTAAGSPTVAPAVVPHSAKKTASKAKAPAKPAVPKAGVVAESETAASSGVANSSDLVKSSQDELGREHWKDLIRHVDETRRIVFATATTLEIVRSPRTSPNKPDLQRIMDGKFAEDLAARRCEWITCYRFSTQR